MTATNVYGVRIGDRFETLADEIESVLVVEEFITPANMTQDWDARCSIEGSQVEARVRVKDLVTGQFKRLEPR